MKTWRGTVADRYKKAGFKNWFFIHVRWLLFPYFERIESFVPKDGEILDLGCGHGLFSHLMALASKGRKVIGVDLFDRRIELARKTVEGNGRLRFEIGDLEEIDLDACDAITLIHVLYLLPFEVQRDLLKQCYARLRMNGRLIIVTLDKTAVLKHWVSYMVEVLKINFKIFANRDQYWRRIFRQQLFYKDPKRLVGDLTDMGFDVKRVYLDAGQHHVVYLCDKGCAR